MITAFTPTPSASLCPVKPRRPSEGEDIEGLTYIIDPSATVTSTGTRTATPTPTISDSSTPSTTSTGTTTASTTNSATNSRTPTTTPSASNTGTPTSSISLTPSNTSTETATPSNTGTPSNTPTSSNTPTRTPTSTGTATGSASRAANQGVAIELKMWINKESYCGGVIIPDTISFYVSREEYERYATTPAGSTVQQTCVRSNVPSRFYNGPDLRVGWNGGDNEIYMSSHCYNHLVNRDDFPIFKINGDGYTGDVSPCPSS